MIIESRYYLLDRKMWAQSLPFPVAVVVKPSGSHGRRRPACMVSEKSNIPSFLRLQLLPLPKPNSMNSSSQTELLLSSSSAIAPSVQLVKALRIRPTAELGLASLLFVLSTAFVALFAVAIICIPAINALRRLAVSVDKLSHVVSQEVPGTLLSLKLSGLEISDLTQQLSSLRQKISSTRWGKNSK